MVIPGHTEPAPGEERIEDEQEDCSSNAALLCHIGRGAGENSHTDLCSVLDLRFLSTRDIQLDRSRR